MKKSLLIVALLALIIAAVATTTKLHMNDQANVRFLEGE